VQSQNVVSSLRWLWSGHRALRRRRPHWTARGD